MNEAFELRGWASDQVNYRLDNQWFRAMYTLQTFLFIGIHPWRSGRMLREPEFTFVANQCELSIDSKTTLRNVVSGFFSLYELIWFITR